MPGLSASELPPEALHAGDTVEYFSRAFVSGDPRGHRRAVVTRVDGDPDAEFPIAVDTCEPVPTDMMVKRVADRFSAPIQAGESLWRKLRTFDLVPGASEAPSQASALNKALAGAVAAAVEAVREAVKDAVDEIVPETPQSSVCSSPEPSVDIDDEPAPSAPSSAIPAPADSRRVAPMCSPSDASEERFVRSSACSSPVQESETGHVPAPSGPGSAISSPADSGEEVQTSKPSTAREEIFERSTLVEIVDLVSSQEDQEVQVAAGGDQPSSVTAQKAAAYLRAIPNRLARAKIRHQPKKKRAQWHVPRSRKRRHLAKCAITRSGDKIFHAKTFKAVKPNALLKSPEVKEQLESLHARRGSFSDPAEKATRTLCRTVPWPANVEEIATCRCNGVKFADIDSVHACTCFGDCFWDVCSNVAAASFCIPKYCGLNARCSNALRTLKTLQLFDTGRVGLGVYTSTALDVGDVLAEYCGDLTEFPALVEGQAPTAMKQNSGYTLLYNAKSMQGNYVYVDALKCGSIARFMCHSCEPNAAFVELQTRARVKVLVKMIKNVSPGAQITVHYGNERWFKCACDRCWNRRDQEADGDADE